MALQSPRGSTSSRTSSTGHRHCRLQHHAPRRHGSTQRAAAKAQAAAPAQQRQQQPGLLYDFHDRLVPYEQAWAWQKQRVAELCDAATADRRDTVFLLQHTPVYTLGAGSDEAHLGFDPSSPPAPLFRTERGGEVTYHGPGQLVLYPVLDLARHTQDLHWYLRSLEEVVLRALAEASGLTGQREPGLTGAWVGGAKLAAIGVRARKWVTYHGLALNVSTDLQPFRHITPCGIADRPVGSVKTALGLTSSSSSNGSSAGLQQQQQPEHDADEHAAAVQDPLIIEYRYALLEALEDVFGLQLQAASGAQVAQLLAGSKSSSNSSSTTSSSSPGTVRNGGCR